MMNLMMFLKYVSRSCLDRMRMRMRLGLALLSSLLFAALPLQAAAFSTGELMDLSLEELMEVDVSSVGRKLQKVSETPAAVFVIRQEDIRRSGATSIPEALRLAPGLNVVRIDGSTWAVSSRGFSGLYLNKLQVLIDGRSIYSPPFSNVYWDMQDTLLEDIERIEVVRGPGGTLWGANAVTGVINIITKQARDTQGALITAGYGTEERGFAALRYGGRVGQRTDYRAFLKYFNRAPLHERDFVYTKDVEAHDDWRAFRGGFRFDTAVNSRDQVTLQGEAHSGTEGQQDLVYTLTDDYFSTRVTSDTRFAGGFLLGRWQHLLDDGGDWTLQSYYDRSYRHEQALGKTVWDVFDVDFQHRFFFGQRQEVLWGFGYRFTRDEIDDGDLITFEDDSADDQLFSAFLQDEISLVPGKLRLLIGSKFEHNDYTGFEYQPNVRLIWTPSSQHALWGAVSRAVRTPSRMEDAGTIFYAVVPPNFFLPTALPTKVVVKGSTDFEAEKCLSYELGYRFMPHSGFSVDTALFYSRYRNHRSAETDSISLQSADSFLYINATSVEGNKLRAETWGVEVAVDWQARPWWQLQGHYSLLQLKTWQDSGSTDVYSRWVFDDSTPQQQASLRSSFDLGRDWDLDLWLRYVDRSSVYITEIDDYLGLDLRLAWRPVPGLEVALVGQNLLDSSHVEFQTEFGRSATGVPRGFYGQVKWQF